MLQRRYRCTQCLKVIFLHYCGNLRGRARFHDRSLLPDILEARRRPFGVAHGVLDVAVTEVSPKRSGIVSLVRERIAAGVPEHVRVSLEPKSGFGTRALDHAGKPSRREWCARSDVNTNGDLGSCSRWSRRRARSSSPIIRMRGGVPCLTLRTCRDAVGKST